MKVMTLLGKRSEIIKLSVLLKVLDQHAEHIVVHTGETKEEILSEVFFRDLELRSPDIDLNDSDADVWPNSLAGKIETLIREFSPKRILVVDGSSAAAAMASANTFGSEIFVLDAGRNSMGPAAHAPTTTLMSFTEASRQSFLRQGTDAARIFAVGNPIQEVLDTFENRIEDSPVMGALSVQPFNYFLATIHRQENLSAEALGKMLPTLGEVGSKFGKTVLFVTHPYTVRKLEKAAISVPPQVRMLRAVNFFDFVKLEKNALAVLSDSVGVQEECSILKVPNIVLSTTTPRPETLACGSSMLAGTDTESILRAVELCISQPAGWDPPAEYLRPNVSQIVSKIFLRGPLA